MTDIFIDLDAEPLFIETPEPLPEPPVVAAEPLASDPNRVRVWCMYCRAFHYHGRPSADGTRHRAAPCGSQCGNTTPYTKTGYVLNVIERGYYAPQKKGHR
jgi:hypothetical protein